MEEGFTCPICYCPAQLTVASLKGCDHCFCFDCAKQWLIESSSTCPICKTEAGILYKHILEAPAGGDASYQEIKKALGPPEEKLVVVEKKLQSDEGAAPELLVLPYQVCESAMRPIFHAKQLAGQWRGIADISAH